MKFLSGVLVGVLVAILLAAVVAAGISAGFMPFFSVDSGCEADAPTGGAFSPRESLGDVERTGDGATRRIVYEADAADSRALAADLCTTIGDLRIVPSADDTVRVVFDISHSGPRASGLVEDADVGIAFARSTSGLAVSAWRESSPAAGWPFGMRAVHVTTTLEVPSGMVLDLDGATDVGDLSLANVAVSALDLETDVGDALIEPRSVVGPLVVRADVGEVSVLLPDDGRYDVLGSADVGDVEVDIGETEDLERERSGPGETVRARGAGDGTLVRVEAATDVGDVRVLRD